MKLRVNISIIVFSVSILAATETLAQTYLSEITVSVEHQEGELKDLVSELEGNTGFTFAYLDESLQNKQISLGQPSWQMDELLREVSVQARVSVKRVGGSIAVADAEKDRGFPQLIDESVSQWSVTGSVFTENHLGMPSASILLLDATDSSFVRGAIADDQGRFLIPHVAPGTYLIQGRMVGFSEGYSGPFEVKDHHVSIDPMELSESTEELDEVIIETQKPLFEQKIDRLVVNVEGSPLLSGGSVVGALWKLPGISIHPLENQLNINGKAGVMIMINNKMRTTNAEESYFYLKGIPAEKVKRVELITNPPAEYDADGIAGIINVVLKENEQEGINGSYSISAGIGGVEEILAGSNINYQSGDLNVFGNLLYNRYGYFDIRRRTVELQNDEYQFQSSTIGSEWEVIDKVSFGVGADYELRPGTSIGLSGDFYLRDASSETDINGTYLIDPGIDTVAMGQRINHNPRDFAAINFFIRHRLSQRHGLEFDANYLLFTNDQTQQFMNQLAPQNSDHPILEDLRVTKVNPTDIWVGRLDYGFDINNQIRLGAGVKASVNMHRNEIRTQRLNEDSYLDDEEFSFFSNMHENIMAAYGSVNVNFVKTRIKSGLRFENTLTRLQGETPYDLLYRKFGNFFPNIFIEQELSKKLAATVSFTSRINRPRFLQFSPAPVFTDPRIFRNGNNHLLPTYTKTFQTTFALDQLILSFEFNQIKNDIWRNPQRRGASNWVDIKPINFESSQIVGFRISYPYIINDWWEISTNVGFFHKAVESNHFVERQGLEKKYLIGNSIQRFQWGQGFSAELLLTYLSGNVLGLTEILPEGDVSIGITKDFGGKIGSLTLNMSNLVNGRRLRNRTKNDIEHLVYVSTQLASRRSIGLRYTNTFGNNKIKSKTKRKGGAEEELERL